TLRCCFPRLRAVFLRFWLPFCLRLTACWSRLIFLRRRLSGLGLAMTVPSQSVASVVTPRSTPTTGPLFAAIAGSCSTSTETYQWPAESETDAERIFTPSVGTYLRSFRRRRPKRGNRTASGKTTMEPVRRNPPNPRFLVLNLG